MSSMILNVIFLASSMQLVDGHIAPSSVEFWSHSAVTNDHGDSALPSGRKHECRIVADSWLMPGIESVDGMPD